MDALDLAREAVGLSIAAEASQGRLHKNGVRSAGVYSVEGTLNAQQHKDLRKFLADNYAGENSGLPMVVDRGAKWLSMAMSGVDAQHLETRRFQVEEVCRAMGVAPTTATAGAHADAYLWVKRPGESDGSCEPGEPPAGRFVNEYAIELVRNVG
jgi:HK97 family phage portal protein